MWYALFCFLVMAFITVTDPVTKSYLGWKGLISLTFNIVVHRQRNSGQTSSKAEI